MHGLKMTLRVNKGISPPADAPKKGRDAMTKERPGRYDLSKAGGVMTKHPFLLPHCYTAVFTYHF